MADISIVVAGVNIYGDTSTKKGTAGEAITIGMAVYQSAGKLYKADCSTAAKAAAVGIAICNAGTDEPLYYATSGGIDLGATITVGTVYGVTDTAGGVGAISERGAADYITILGVGLTTSKIGLDIQQSGVAVPA